MQHSPRLASASRVRTFALVGSLALFSACVPILGIEEPEKGQSDACRQFVCTNGTCADEYAPYLNECGESKVCDGLGTCKLGPLAPCSVGKESECASGLCLEDQCRLIAGDPCNNDDECSPGRCSDFTCKLPDGSSCEFSSECVSGVCVNMVCLSSDGTLCSADSDCASGGCDAMSCKPSAGKPCQNNTECGSNTCLANTCVGPSCGGLDLICGPASNESCCDSVSVPGGMFLRSNDSKAPGTVNKFWLDRYEVSVARFRRFVEMYPDSKPAEGAGQHPILVGSAWNSAWDSELPATREELVSVLNCSATSTWNASAGSNDQLPINCVDWYLAFAFCAWDGGRLPTEAEWNFAAAGLEQREYPWPTPITPPNIDETYAVYNCSGAGDPTTCSSSDILAVGSKSTAGDGLWGNTDLAGSMYEWVLDGYSPTYVVPCVNCAELMQTEQRIRRGGSWRSAEMLATTYARQAEAPTTRDDQAGFRCARDL